MSGDSTFHIHHESLIPLPQTENPGTFYELITRNAETHAPRLTWHKHKIEDNGAI